MIQKMEYEVIASSSKGNATILNSILVDCGVPYKYLQPNVKRISLVLLTHEHGDHFSRTTIKRLAAERPTLRFGTPDYLVQKLCECGVNSRNIDVIEAGIIYDYGFCKLESFSLVHNVPNVGWKILFENGEKALYATDTNRIDHVRAKDFSYYFIEANYTESEIVERIRSKQESGEHVYEWDVLQNHLSREKAEDFIYQNMGANSQYVLLHGHED